MKPARDAAPQQALMVMGTGRGAAFARAHGLDALFLHRREGGDTESVGVGRFAA